jgi:thioredoxin-dependent peroxiredoxin
MAIQAGKAAPAFTLLGPGGKPVALEDYAGKHVILYFYPKDDTPGCTKEACGFRDAWREIQSLGAVVLGVSADGSESHARFVAKYKLPFPLLSDPDRKVMTKYGAYGEKMLYGKKTTGVIRSTVWIGPDGKVRKHWARVAKAEAHPEQVLDALRGAAA